MIDKLDYELLITPQEAVKLSQYRPVKDIGICIDIETILREQKGEMDKDLFHSLLTATIWNGGRVQGIREERRKKTNYGIAH